MNRTATLTRIQPLDLALLREALATVGTRRLVYRTAGHRQGSITRLVSPSDLGELIKPFVFLDHAEVPFTGRKLFGIHPHSGIANIALSSF